MKSIMLLLFSCWSATAFAQQKIKTKAPGRDTVRIAIPKEKKFNPANAKLRNSKIKTPVYNSTLTGTNAPGDVNTGLSVDNTSHHVEVNPTQQRVKEIRDSLKHSPRPN